MPTPKPLIISNFQNGIAESPYVGIGDMRNCDIITKPGAVMVGLLPEQRSSGVFGDNANIMKIVRDVGTKNFYAVDELNNLYTSTSANAGATWTAVTHASKSTGVGNGLIIWKDYLFLLANTSIDVYGPLSGSPTWDNAWQSNLTSDTYHPAIHAQDDILYIGHGRYIASIKELSGQDFNPDTSATYTYTQKALDLPEGYRARTIQELGKELMIGTWVADTIFIGDIFPWDRTSDSFRLPLRSYKEGIRAALTQQNLMYFIAGNTARLYVTDGERITQLPSIPTSVSGFSGSVFADVYPNAIAWMKDRLIYGVSTSNQTGDFYGTWAYNRGKLMIDSQVSSDIQGTNEDIRIGSLLSRDEEAYLVGFKDSANTKAGVDLISNSKRYGSYKAYIETKFYDVGFKYEKRTYRTLEVRLGKDLATNEGVRIKYRENLSDAWTTLATFTDADHTHRKDVMIQVSSLQLRIELTTDGAGGNSNSSPELLAVILR